MEKFDFPLDIKESLLVQDWQPTSGSGRSPRKGDHVSILIFLDHLDLKDRHTSEEVIE